MVAQDERTGQELVALRYTPFLDYYGVWYWASPNRQWFVNKYIDLVGPCLTQMYPIMSLATVRRCWSRVYITKLEKQLRKEWSEGRANQPTPKPVRRDQ